MFQCAESVQNQPFILAKCFHKNKSIDLTNPTPLGVEFQKKIDLDRPNFNLDFEPYNGNILKFQVLFCAL